MNIRGHYRTKVHQGHIGTKEQGLGWSRHLNMKRLFEWSFWFSSLEMDGTLGGSWQPQQGLSNAMASFARETGVLNHPGFQYMTHLNSKTQRQTGRAEGRSNPRPEGQGYLCQIVSSSFLQSGAYSMGNQRG
jgi:hypothetical protein